MKLDKMIWVLYPAVVLVFMFVTLNFLINDAQTWQALLGPVKTEAGDDEKRAQMLEEKLASLNTVNTEAVQADLNFLATTIPTSRQVWLLIAGLERSASESGANLETYRGTVGDVKEGEATASAAVARARPQNENLELSVVYKVSGMPQLVQLLGYLEKTRPLVKVSKAIMDGDDVTLTVEGAWSPWTKLSAEALNTSLPEFRQVLDEVKTRTGDFGFVAELGNPTDLPVSGVTNPF